MPYKDEHAVRLREPIKGENIEYRRTVGSGEGYVQGIKIPDTIDVIWMIDNNSDNPHPIAQSLRFSADEWTVDEIKDWLEKNKIKYIGIEEAKKEMERIFETKIKATKDKQKILTLPRGKFYIEKYDEIIEFNDEIFNDIINNFKDESLSKPFIDLNHKYEESYGDIVDMSIEEEGLYTYWILNEKGIELIKNKQYKYISPAIYDIKDTKGELHKNVLIAVTLTNVPALLGALPQLQEQLQLSYFEKTEGGKRMDSVKLELGLETNVNEAIVLNRVKELKNELDNSKKELEAIKKELSEIKVQKEKAEKVATELGSELEAIKQEQLKKEAEEVIKKAIELGQYNPKLYELKVNQYLKDKETVLKELEILPKNESSQKTSSQAINDFQVDEKTKIQMERAGLDWKNKEDYLIFVKEFKKD